MSEQAVADRLSQARGLRVLTEDPFAPPHEDHPGVDMSGVYEILCLFWEEPYIILAPHPVTGALVETQRHARHRQGDLAHIGNLQARRLLAAGAIARPGEREAAELARVEAYAAQVKSQSDAAQQRMEAKQAEMTAAASTFGEWTAGVADPVNPGVQTGPSLAPQ